MILTLIGTLLFATIHFINSKNNYKFIDHIAERFILQEFVVKFKRYNSRNEVRMQDCRTYCALCCSGISSSRWKKFKALFDIILNAIIEVDPTKPSPSTTSGNSTTVRPVTTTSRNDTRPSRAKNDESYDFITLFQSIRATSTANCSRSTSVIGH